MDDGVGFFSMILIGLIAGYIAERVTESNHGLIKNLIVGLIGSFVGGIIARAVDAPPTVGFVANLVVATLGAILFLFIWRKIRGGGRRAD
jgi:uncharacterized membrane protein YeaQ/YmgE (transglycosylase-associated protein family)